MVETADYYVAVDGDDANDGSETSPLRTVQAAVDRVAAGELIYVRGGTYDQPYHEPITIEDTAGTESEPIRLEGYPGERPHLRWGGGPGHDDWQVWGGVVLTGDSPYWAFRNLEVSGSEWCGFQTEGDSNAHSCVFEDLYCHDLGQKGVWAETNDCVIRNVEVHDCYNEPSGGEHGDGLGMAGVDGGLIENCVVYNNSDDGIDLWTSRNVTIRDTVTHSNGYDSDGDGNGFKSANTDEGGANEFIRCVSYDNQSRGFRAYSPIADRLVNCTAYNNDSDGFSAIHGGDHEIVNCLDDGSGTSFHSGVVDSSNSWNLGIDDPGFASTDPSSDSFLRLAAGSPAIDAGTDVGLTYSGPAPDLGAYEYDAEGTDDTTDESMWGPVTIYYHTGEEFVEVAIKNT